jgi:hypothetical protein
MGAPSKSRGFLSAIVSARSCIPIGAKEEAAVKIKHLLLRGVIAMTMFNAGLLVANYTIEERGMAHPRNPAWRLVHGILTFELEMLRFMAWGLAISLAIALVVFALDIRIFEPKREQTRAARRAIEREEAKIREAEISERWRQDREKEKRNFREWIEESNTREKIRRTKEEARLKARTPEEVKADAIHDITKGW